MGRHIDRTLCGRTGKHLLTLPSRPLRADEHICDRTPDGEVHDGENVALKPAYEPIVMARKPLSEGSVAANVLARGTGAINVDACRITAAPEDIAIQRARTGGVMGANHGRTIYGPGVRRPAGHPTGRWPANVLLDTEAAAMLDEQSGERESGNAGRDGHHRNQPPRENGGIYGGGKGLWRSQGPAGALYGDTGGASRFYFTAKADSAERSRGLGQRNGHPTVKPVDLMAWLIRLVTPPGGIVLDPFLGSGSTAVAAQGAGFRWVGIELSPQYAELAIQRIGLFAELVRAAR